MVATQSKQDVQGVVERMKPFVEMLLKALDRAGPFVDAVTDLLARANVLLAPYHPEEFLPVLFGLVLIVFGGHFPVTIAAIEAFRICGWDRTKRSLLLLWHQYKVAMEASRKDDQLDENKDGIADVKQIDTKTLLTRKMGVFLKACNPEAVNDGVQGLAAGTAAVIATLRLQFAQTVTLGASLGDLFTKTVDQFVRPPLERALPQEYSKWVPLLIQYGCRSVAMSIAWWCQRIISALHSSFRGAQLLLVAAATLAKRYNLKLPVDLSPEHSAFPAACGAIGGLGLYSQLSRGFALSFPLNILLLPLRVLEWALFYMLAPKS